MTGTRAGAGASPAGAVSALALADLGMGMGWLLSGAAAAPAVQPPQRGIQMQQCGRPSIPCSRLRRVLIRELDESESLGTTVRAATPAAAAAPTPATSSVFVAAAARAAGGQREVRDGHVGDAGTAVASLESGLDGLHGAAGQLQKLTLNVHGSTIKKARRLGG